MEKRWPLSGKTDALLGRRKTQQKETSEVKSVAMPIGVVCPSCRQKFSAPDIAAGKKTKCPICDHPFTIPASRQEANHRETSSRVGTDTGLGLEEMAAAATSTQVNLELASDALNTGGGGNSHARRPQRSAVSSTEPWFYSVILFCASILVVLGIVAAFYSGLMGLLSFGNGYAGPGLLMVLASAFGLLLVLTWASLLLLALDMARKMRSVDRYIQELVKR